LQRDTEVLTLIAHPPKNNVRLLFQA